MWVAVLIYVALVARRTGRVKSDIDDLRRELEKLESSRPLRSQLPNPSHFIYIPAISCWGSCWASSSARAGRATPTAGRRRPPGARPPPGRARRPSRRRRRTEEVSRRPAEGERPFMAIGFDFTEEQEALVQTAREFTRKEIIPKAGHWTRRGVPRRDLKKAWETGLMNVEVPEAYGGLGGSCLDNCLVQEEVAFGCAGINTSMAATRSARCRCSSPAPTSRRRSTSARLTGRADVLRVLLLASPMPASDVAGMRTRVTQARRRLRAQRPEALDHERRRRRLLHGVRDVRPRDEAQGHRLLRRRRARRRASSRAAKRTRWVSARRTRPT